MISQTSAPPDMELVKSATRKLAHRGPDGEGYFAEGALAFGHRRLAIIDLSAAAAQPMKRFGYTIIYNGELYNYLELRLQLIEQGYQFETESDTEVLLAAYDFWGTDCLHHFKGMWAFAVYEPAKQQLFCARDRFGMKPFYFCQQDGQCCFASEIKAFTVLPGWQPRINQQTAFDFMARGWQHRGADTLFAGVHQLLPGQQMIYDLQKHKVEISTYYELPEQSDHLSFNEATAQFHSLFSNAVQIHLRADVKTGVALSGGLDSSSILSQCAARQDAHSYPFMHTVSYCADDPALNECGYVDILQDTFKIQSHRLWPAFDDLLLLLDDVIVAQDEPLLSSSLLAQYAVFGEAKKQELKVMLDGQGGDELLAGYPTYYLPLFKDVWRQQPWRLLELAFQFLQHKPVALRKLVYKLKRSDNYHTLLKVKGEPGRTERQEAGSNFGQYSRAMIRTNNLPALLHFEDRNSMSHSVEARLPFLDHELVEFCLQLPADYKIRAGRQKVLLREAMKDDLPAAIAWRRDKLGFKAPQDIWMIKQQELLLRQITHTVKKHPTFFHLHTIEWAEKVLRQKAILHFPFLWRMFTFGKWCELYNLQD